MKPIGHYRAIIEGCCRALLAEMPEAAGAMVVIFVPKDGKPRTVQTIGISMPRLTEDGMSPREVLRGVERLVVKNLDQLDLLERGDDQGEH